MPNGKCMFILFFLYLYAFNTLLTCRRDEHDAPCLLKYQYLQIVYLEMFVLTETRAYLMLQQYLDAAELDRERYLQELTAYKKTEAYRLFTQKQASKKQKEESQDEVSTTLYTTQA